MEQFCKETNLGKLLHSGCTTNTSSHHPPSAQPGLLHDQYSTCPSPWFALQAAQLERITQSPSFTQARSSLLSSGGSHTGRVIKYLRASAEEPHTRRPRSLGETLPPSAIPFLIAPKGHLLTEQGCDGAAQTPLTAPVCDLPFPSLSECGSHKGLRQRL